ncbi:hypothetical protein GYM69_04420 [Lactobacillus panisapium]|uniref:phage tail terminator family protein n=1 Tax=Lactobacillus panisapium TaxID=2012495 RepID=UPI001C6A8140|nr:hypothetical protein [Lactobacillus panisapium]QYN56418.1 hypothetical protein GYM69_04420 [Lactobacillus panisapium]
MTIIERISDEIARIFPNAVIYTENQSDGFEEPSFFIEKISSSASSELFDRQMRKQSYQVVYFPNPDNPKTDMERVEDYLLSGLLELKDYAPLRHIEVIQQDDNTLIYKFEVWGRFYPDKKDDIKLQNSEVKGNIK